jgi:SAM-dependent methyltransferase
MWRVKLYISARSALYRHPKLKNWIRKTYLYRTLMPLVFNFDRSFSDRRYMTQHILPALATPKVQRVLFVGCKAYTARYGKRLARAGVDYWTTDINPAVAIWGEKDHHIISDIGRIDDVCPADSFDAVLLNGVIGDGVDDESEMNRAVTAIARILRPNGMLLIGWDALKKLPDPIGIEAVTTYFRHESALALPVRKTFPDTDKVYDWLIKTRAAEANSLDETTPGGIVRS